MNPKTTPLAGGIASLLFATLLNVAVLNAAPAEPGKEAAPTTHMMFLGADVSIKHQNEPRQVQRVEYGKFYVDIKGKLEAVSFADQEAAIRVSPVVKVSDVILSVSNLKVERAYTPGNDPKRIAIQNQLSLDSAQSEAMQRGSKQMAVGPTIKVLGDDNVWRDVKNPKYDPAMRDMAITGQIDSTKIADSIMRDDLSKEGFDAVSVEFETQAPKRLGHPYMILVATLTPPDDERKTGSWIFAKALDAVDETPRKVSFLQAGFPRGFNLKEYSIHIYDGTREVATTVAQRQVPMTRDQVFQYNAVIYVLANKGKTLEAGLAPGQSVASLEKAQVPRPLFVRVKKDGLPSGVFLDERCEKEVPQTVAETVKRLQFVPALANGKPLDGVAKLL